MVPTLQVRDDVWFQYPLRVEVGCNTPAPPTGAQSRPVSVPSTGRSGLQLTLVTPQNWGCLCFSTLYGSKWVATRWAHSRAHCAPEFQYPLRVEVGCNKKEKKKSHSRRVSVPSTGRSGLQPLTYPDTTDAPVVSVPSTGRSGLQRNNAKSASIAICSFSTLYGSKWVATLQLRS